MHIKMATILTFLPPSPAVAPEPDLSSAVIFLCIVYCPHFTPVWWSNRLSAHRTWPLRKPSFLPSPPDRLKDAAGWSPSTLGAGDGETFFVPVPEPRKMDLEVEKQGGCIQNSQLVLSGISVVLVPLSKLAWEWEGREMSWAPGWGEKGVWAKGFPPTTQERHKFSAGVFASLHMKSATCTRWISFGWRQTKKPKIKYGETLIFQKRLQHLHLLNMPQFSCLQFSKNKTKTFLFWQIWFILNF